MLKPVVKQFDENGLHHRWMLRRDMDEVIAIDRSHVWERWGENDYLAILGRRDCIGVVTEEECGRIASVMIQRITKRAYTIEKICVRQDLLRIGIAASMVGKLTSRLKPQSRTSVVADVKYTNLIAQKFFSSQGFIATPLDDVICFEYAITEFQE